MARSSAFAERKKLERATWQQVRDALKPGEAAVEFARFDSYDKGWTGAGHYVALVLTSQTKDQPQYIVLGDDKQIEGGAISRAFSKQYGHVVLPWKRKAVYPEPTLTR